MHNNRDFNENDYERFDTFGKKIAKQWCKDLFLKIDYESNGDRKYSVDFSLTDTEGVSEFLFGHRVEKLYLEVEVRPEWNKKIFPYSTMHIPDRKEKNIFEDYPTVFMSVSKCGDYVGTVPGSLVKKSNKVNVCAINRSTGLRQQEPFFDVELKHVIFWEKQKAIAGHPFYIYR
jgi:hypothetical protein